MAKIYQNEHGLPFVDVGGRKISLGLLKPDPMFSALPEAGTAFPTLPQSEWKENSLRPADLPVRDQGEYGSCASVATSTCFAASKALAGHKLELWSGTFVYSQINHGVDQGSRISDAMLAIRDIGICLASEFPMSKIYKSQVPQEAYQTAKRFRALDIYKITNFDQLCSALTLGYPVVSGIAAGNNLVHGQLHSNGLAYLPDVVVGGHALAHLGLKIIDNKWCVLTLNSWGTQFGDKGYFYLQREHWNPGYGLPFDAFTILSVIDDPQDLKDDIIAVK